MKTFFYRRSNEVLVVFENLIDYVFIKALSENEDCLTEHTNLDKNEGFHFKKNKNYSCD